MSGAVTGGAQSGQVSLQHQLPGLCGKGLQTEPVGGHRARCWAAGKELLRTRQPEFCEKGRRPLRQDCWES